MSGLHQGCDILANYGYMVVSAVLNVNDIYDYCFSYVTLL